MSPSEERFMGKIAARFMRGLAPESGKSLPKTGKSSLNRDFWPILACIVRLIL